MLRTNQLAVFGLTAFVIAGCNRTPPVDAPSLAPNTGAELTEVTLYLANMNRQLKIL